MSELNLEQAKQNMIKQQIRPWDVLDQQVLDVLSQVPREDFVPLEFHNLAFADIRIPIGHGQVMMTPKVEGRMIQALAIKPDDTVLEIGTGSAYVTALLARLGRHIYSVEIHPELKMAAEKKLATHRIHNVSLEVGNAACGWDAHAPYDAIAITGSLPLLPESFKKSLAIGGRLFVIVGDSPVMEALLITRLGEDEWSQESLFETDLTALENAIQPERFVL